MLRTYVDNDTQCNHYNRKLYRVLIICVLNKICYCQVFAAKFGTFTQRFFAASLIMQTNGGASSPGMKSPEPHDDTLGSDQTNEYNLSLNFGAEKAQKSSPKSTSSERNNGFLHKLEEEFDETTANILTSPVQIKQYTFQKHVDTQVDPRDNEDEIGMVETQKIDAVDETQKINTIDDTQKINQIDDTQKITDVGSETRGTVETQGDFIEVDMGADTQIIQSKPETERRVLADTQIDVGLESTHGQLDDTQKIDKDTQKIPVFKDPSSNEEIISTPVESRKSQKTQESEKTEDGYLTFNRSNEDTGNGTSGYREEPKGENVLASEPNSNAADQTPGDQNAINPSTSPRSQTTTGTIIQVPGTVERDPQTQVFHTQEETSEPVIEEDVEAIETDDEDMGQMYDDSILTHRMKFKRRIEENSSPYKAAEVIRSPPPETDDGVSLKKLKISVNLSTSSLSQVTVPVLRHETGAVLEEIDIESKRSVWANHKFKMYPGFIIDANDEILKVMFEEGKFDIGTNDLYPLDIRIGDVVKHKGYNTSYTVTGLGFQASKSDASICCVRGYNTVYVKKIQTRKAIMEGKNNTELKFPLSSILMELNEWYKHQQLYSITQAFDGAIGKDLARTPTRNRLTQEKIERSPRSRVSNRKGIFFKALFCITSVDDDTKELLSSMITSNGGEIIEDGFQELFQYQTRAHCRLAYVDADEANEVRFVALVSRDVSRSAKYLQTLALGWPILSEIFIHDCVSDPSNFNNWPAYLLGAGHSSKTGGIKSLDIFKFRSRYEAGNCISSQVNLNGHLLNDYTVVGLTSKSSKMELEACKFIFYAFGVKKLIFKSNVNEFKKEISKLEDQEKVLIYDQGRVSNGNTISWEWVVQCCISNHIWKTSGEDL